MIVNRGRDFFGFALGAGVKATDDALEFGEFLDQFGGEIGLRKHVLRARRGIAAQLFHQSDDAFASSADTSQALA